MQCNECCREAHAYLPFHRVEAWKGSHFEPAWLWQNSVVIHLGHNGDKCPTAGDEYCMAESLVDDDFDSDSEPDSDLESEFDSDWDTESETEDANTAGSSTATPRGPKTTSVPPLAVHPETANPRKANLQYPVLVIVDVTGIHEIPVHYCSCPGPLPVSNDHQLLESGLFPATFKRVRTAFTFRVLDDFRLDNLESKTSAYHYYNKLRHLTCPAFPGSVKVCVLVTLLEEIY